MNIGGTRSKTATKVDQPATPVFCINSLIVQGMYSFTSQSVVLHLLLNVDEQNPGELNFLKVLTKGHVTHKVEKHVDVGGQEECIT
jgi:hypothetical protein